MCNVGNAACVHQNDVPKMCQINHIQQYESSKASIKKLVLNSKKMVEKPFNIMNMQLSEKIALISHETLYFDHINFCLQQIKF